MRQSTKFGRTVGGVTSIGQLVNSRVPDLAIYLRTGLTKFTLFETLYVILLNIHKMHQAKEDKDVYHILWKKKEVLHSLAQGLK